MLLSIIVTVSLLMTRPFAVTKTYLATTLCHHWIDLICGIIPLLLTGLSLFWLRRDCILLEDSQKEDFLSLLGQSHNGAVTNSVFDPTIERRPAAEGRNSSLRMSAKKLKDSIASRPSQRSVVSKKVTNMLVINLEFLWERISRFQVFLFSVFFGDLMWLIRIIFLMVGSKSYTEYGSCELIYALAINKSRSFKVGGSWKWAFLSALGDVLFYSLVTVFPTIFVLDIIQATLFKKGVNVATEITDDRNSEFFQSAERVDSKLMKLEESFEDHLVPSGPQLQDIDGNIAVPRVKKKLVSDSESDSFKRQKMLQSREEGASLPATEENVDYYRASID